MKKYRKNPTKLLQIRLAKDEYEAVEAFIKRFGTTKREWVLAVISELKEAQVIRGGQFWRRHADYAYANISSKVPLKSDDECEICGGRATLRHHHDGYEGDNAFKVHKLCNKCHGKVHVYKNQGMDFEQSKVEVLRSFNLDKIVKQVRSG